LQIFDLTTNMPAWQISEQTVQLEMADIAKLVEWVDLAKAVVVLNPMTVVCTW
jgi:hypothetical protein